MMIRKQKIESLKEVMLEVRKGKEQSKKDKKKEGTLNFLERYQQKIIADYDKLYSNSTFDKVMEVLKSLEKKVYLDGEIKKNELVLTNAKKIFNDNIYEYNNKKKKLQQLKEQAELMDIMRLEEGVQILEQKQNEVENYRQMIQDEHYLQQTLQYMMEERKEKQDQTKIYVEGQYKKLRKLAYQIIMLQKHKSECEMNENDKKQLIEKLKQEINDYKQFNIKLSDHFEDQLNDELSQFEDKRVILQIFQQEQKRKQEIQRDLVRQLEEEQTKQREETNKAIQDVKDQDKQIDKKLTILTKKFQDLRKVTYFSNSDDLLKHRQFLLECNTQIEEFKLIFEQKIRESKQDIEKLNAKLKVLKYEKEDEQNIIEEDPINLDQIDKELWQETEKANFIEHQTKKRRKVVDNIATSISRVLYQLQSKKNRNIEVNQDDLLKNLSLCSLRLEKMLAILSQKKDSIKVESVNTDSTYKLPPEFLGINQKQIVVQKKRTQLGVSQSSKVNDGQQSAFSIQQESFGDEGQELDNMQSLRQSIQKPDAFKQDNQSSVQQSNQDTK